MKKENLLRILSSIFVIMVVFLSPNFASAAYPEKPVSLIVGYTAGGTTDLVARHLVESIKKHFPQPMVVVNRPGAASALGTSETVQAQPDGYTINLGTLTALGIQPHRVNLPYSTPDTYTPISMVTSLWFNLVVKSDAPWNNLKDFIEYAKANPGKVRVTHFGLGHITHLILEELKIEAKIDLSSVPSSGGADSNAAIMGGHVEAGIIGTQEIAPLVQGKKLKVLGVFDTKRSPAFPEVPTFKELGYNVTRTSYNVLIGPKGLPKEVVSKLQGAYKKVSEDPIFIEYMKKMGLGVHYEIDKELAEHLWRDYNSMGKILDQLGLKKK